MDYRGFLEKGYGLLATKFKDYRLFVLHFKITDYYQSLSHCLPLYKMVLKGLKSYKKKDTYILSPARTHGQNFEPKDNINPAEREASPEA